MYDVQIHKEKQRELEERISLASGGVKKSLEYLSEFMRVDNFPFKNSRRVEVRSRLTDDEPWRHIKNYDDVPPFRGRNYSVDSSLVEISGGTLIPRNLIVFDDRIYIDELRKMRRNWETEGIGFDLFDVLHCGGYDPASRTLLIEDKSIRELDDQFVYFVCHANTAHYNWAHFIQDFFYQIEAIDDLKKEYGDRLKLIFPTHRGIEFKYPIMTRVLECVGIKEDDYFIDDACFIKLPKAFTTTHAWTADRINTRLAYYAKNRIRQSMTKSDGRRQIIYITRIDEVYEKRSILNFAEFEAMLEDFDVKSVVLSEMSPDEIMMTFSNAKAVIGLHGAGMMNQIFTPPDCVLLEVYHARSIIGNAMLACIGWQQKYVPCKPRLVAENGTVEADIDFIRSQLEAL